MGSCLFICGSLNFSCSNAGVLKLLCTDFYVAYSGQESLAVFTPPPPHLLFLLLRNNLFSVKWKSGLGSGFRTGISSQNKNGVHPLLQCICIVSCLQAAGSENRILSTQCVGLAGPLKVSFLQLAGMCVTSKIREYICGMCLNIFQFTISRSHVFLHLQSPLKYPSFVRCKSGRSFLSGTVSDLLDFTLHHIKGLRPVMKLFFCSTAVLTDTHLSFVPNGSGCFFS